MIEKVQVRNYRSCIDTTINLQPDLSVLIGPNGSGKTNLLHAILLLRRLLAYTRLRPEHDSATDQAVLRAWFKLGGKQAIFTAQVSLYTEENNNDVIVEAKETWYAKDFTNSRKRVAFPLWLVQESSRRDMASSSYALAQTALHYHARPWGRYSAQGVPESFRQPLSAFARYIADMKYYSASQFTNPSHCPVAFEIEKKGQYSRGLSLRGHSRFLFDLYRAKGDSATSNYDQFFDVIGPSGIGLIDKIDFEEILTSSTDYRVRSGGRVNPRKREKLLVIPKFTIGRNQLSPSQLSEGTFKTITLLFYVMTESSSALLIEEPEVCVHHGLLSSIIELIKTFSKEKQIIVSTHSDFVLDQVGAEHVYRVVRDGQHGTKISAVTKSMSRQELLALKKYLESEGNLGEYWRHGGLE